MKIVFMGTPEIAVPALRAIDDKYGVEALVCQPDKAVGRKMIITPPETKVFAEGRGIKVFQPQSIRRENDFLFEMKPDLIVVMAYGKILPKEILQLPKYGCINLHASLLPKYRGAAPIQWSIFNGDCATGVTVMRMDEGMDTGDIIESFELKIAADDTAVSLFSKIAELAAERVCGVIDDIVSNKASYKKQDESLSTRAPMINKEDGLVSFTGMTAEEICNAYRAFAIWPQAYFEASGINVKIISAKPAEQSGKAGTIASTKPLAVFAKQGTVILEQVKPQGSREMQGNEYIAGRRLKAGDSIL